MRVSCVLIFIFRRLFELANHLCRVPGNNLPALRKAFRHDRARTHNGVVTQHHAGQNGGIHTDPAVFAKHDVFAGLMLLQIGQHMVRRDKTDIRRDITAFANDDFGGEILKIAAERVKIIHIIRVENQIFRAAYFIAERNRERTIAIDALYLLHPQVSPAPCPAETGFLKPATTQKLFIVKQRHNKF